MTQITLTGDLAQRLHDLAEQSQTSVEELLAEMIKIPPPAPTELRQLKRAVEQSPASVIITDVDGNIEYVNPHFTALTGYTAAEAVGQNPRILKSGQTPPETYPDLWATVTAGNVWRGEFINKKKDGSFYWDHAIISPVTDDDGQITHYVSVKIDVTRRKEAELALRESEARYRQLVELSPDAIVVHASGTVVYVNHATLKLFGAANADDLIGTPVLEHIHPDYRAAVIDRIRTMTEQKTTVPLIEEKMLRLDGTVFDCEVVATHISYNNQPAMQVIIRDITERKQMDKRLRKSEATARALLNAPEDTVFLMDHDLTVVDANTAMTQRQGRSLENIIGQYGPDLLPALLREESIAHARQTFDTGQPARWEHERDGSWYDVRLYPVWDNDSIVRLAVVSRDITEHKHAETALRESEERYRDLFENANDLIQSVAPDGAFIYANRAWRETLGYNEAEIRNLSMFDVIHPDSQAHCLDIFQRVLDGEPALNIEAIFVTKGGETIVVEGNISGRLKDGVPVSTRAIFRDVTQRKQAEDALHASEERLRSTIASLDDLVFALNRDNVFTDYYQPSAQQDLLAPPEAFLGKSIRDVLPPHVVSLTEDHIDAVVKTDTVQQFDYPLHIGETEAWFNAKISNRKNAEGESVGTTVVIRNITERTRREQTEREFQHHLRTLHEINLTLGELNNLDDLYRRAIELGRERLGFDRLGLLMLDPATDELRGTWGTDPQGQVCDERTLRVTTEGRTRFEDVLETQDRIQLWEDVVLEHRDEPVGHGWVGLAALWSGDTAIGYLSTDNLIAGRAPRSYETELVSLYATMLAHLIVRQKSNDALRVTEARFRTLIENAPVGIIGVDWNGHVILANEEAARLSGYDREELSNIHFRDLLSSYGASRISVLRLIRLRDKPGEASPLPHIETLARRKDGVEIPVELSVATVHLGGEQIILAFIQDVTQRKIGETQRIQLSLERERSTVLTHFMQDATHEFRTPLSTLYTDLYMLERVEDETSRERLLDAIKFQINRIHQLVESLVTMMRLDGMEAGVLQKADINHVVDMALTPARSEAVHRNHTLNMQLGNDLPNVAGDADDLLLAVSNILRNALRFTPAGGVITVRTETIAEGVAISVQDDGPGLSQEEQARIFERFYRGDPTHTTVGFGLGLPMAKRAVELYGGRIEIDSQPGHGSTFTIILPLPNQIA